ncbi:MAG: hypothetical protein ACXV5D_03590 [Halobacteriota archaeon]
MFPFTTDALEFHRCFDALMNCKLVLQNVENTVTIKTSDLATKHRRSRRKDMALVRGLLLKTLLLQVVTMEVNQEDQQELVKVVTEWLKDALGRGADFSGLKVEAVADDEFYFCYLKDSQGREYRFRVFWRFDDKCKLDPVVIDFDTGLRVRSPGTNDGL